MRKQPVVVSSSELTEILERYFDTETILNYAVKIVGHPGIGKSAIVRQAAERKSLFFIDTRLAFKENVDLGGYPVPDHELKRMIYYRPKFIPPEKVPDGYRGIAWFLDEANRAHPTVIQTLFQIITERTCGEHLLPDRTYIVLAGNLGEGDDTTITEFDDAALDGRLAIFHLKPTARDWIPWAESEGLHPAVLRYISLYPDRLWDEVNIDPNPRGWHQVSTAIASSHGLSTEEDLAEALASDSGALRSIIHALVGRVAGDDFISQITAPRLISSRDILNGSRERLDDSEHGRIPPEDMLWALFGALHSLRDAHARGGGRLDDEGMRNLANTLLFIGSSRSDLRLSFIYLLMRDCGIFTQVPPAMLNIPDEKRRLDLLAKLGAIIEKDDEG